MTASLRKRIRERAGNRCEYCRIREADEFYTYQIEHVVARQHRGADDDSNLALACPSCNRRKGPNLSAIDPETNLTVPLFNPRTDGWENHFVQRGARIAGLTPTGRATVRLLEMNHERRLEFRAFVT